MINKVILIGRVGAEPEIRTLESGVKVATLRLATSERIYNKETKESSEVTEWHSVTLWRNLADVVDAWVRKGSLLYIEGKLKTRDYEKNGQKHYVTDILATEMKMLGGKPTEGAGNGAATTYNTKPEEPSIEPTPTNEGIDDLPF